MVTEQVIDQFIKLWKCKQFAVFVRPKTITMSTSESTEHQNSDTQPNSTDDGDDDDDDDASMKPKLIDSNYLFSLVFSPVYVFAQQNKPATSFDKLANLMTKLIKNGLMSIAFLNEQSMNLMQQWNHSEWNQVFISILLIFN